MSRQTKISDAEWEVMTVLWHGSPLSSQQVVDALAESTDWSPKTVKTLLARLVKKEVLGFETEANRYLYFPLVSREDTVREETRSFMDRVFGGDVSSMLVQFVKDADLTDGEVSELRRLLDEKGSDEEAS